MAHFSSETVAQRFDDVAQAQSAASDLERAGFPKGDISVIARSPTEIPEKRSNAEDDAAAGAAIGGIGGLVLSLATLAVPGVGPVLAAGPILAALGGAGVGAVAGGLIGALAETGVSKSAAESYAEGIRRGDAVVAVRANADDAERARRILCGNAADDKRGGANAVEADAVKEDTASLRERGDTGYPAGADIRSADEIRREDTDYASTRDRAYEWKNMSEKERKHAVRENAAGDWPHKEAFDIGDSLVEAEAENAAVDTGRTEQAAKETLGKKPRDLESEVGTPGTHHNAGESSRKSVTGRKKPKP